MSAEDRDLTLEVVDVNGQDDKKKDIQFGESYNKHGLYASGKFVFSANVNGNGVKATVVDVNGAAGCADVSFEGTVSKPQKPCTLF